MSRSKRRSHCTRTGCRLCNPWKDYGNGAKRFRGKEPAVRRALAEQIETRDEFDRVYAAEIDARDEVYLHDTLHFVPACTCPECREAVPIAS